VCRATVLCASGRIPLQRLFSTFPGGRPGIGLLLLRVAIGGGAATLGVVYFSGLIERTSVVYAVAALLLAGGISLLAGFLTPFSSSLVGLCILGIAFSLVPSPPSVLNGAQLISFVIVLIAASIAMLGPGAYSVDGYLFGRREIVIPPRGPESQS
jgi:uncharacterized membrane protein YphA (DoxX/SURF4 family)